MLSGYYLFYYIVERVFHSKSQLGFLQHQWSVDTFATTSVFIPPSSKLHNHKLLEQILFTTPHFKLLKILPHHSTPLHTTPHHTTPHHNTPNHSTPLHTTPHHTTPHHSTPHHTTPNHTTPHHSTPHHTTPHHTTPHHTTLYHTTPYHTTPHHTTPHHTTPHHTISHHTISHHTTPHQSNTRQFIQLLSKPLQATQGHSRPLQATPSHSKPLQATPGHSRPLQTFFTLQKTSRPPNQLLHTPTCFFPAGLNYWKITEKTIFRYRKSIFPEFWFWKLFKNQNWKKKNSATPEKQKKVSMRTVLQPFTDHVHPVIKTKKMNLIKH